MLEEDEDPESATWLHESFLEEDDDQELEARLPLLLEKISTRLYTDVLKDVGTSDVFLVDGDAFLMWTYEGMYEDSMSDAPENELLQKTKHSIKRILLIDDILFSILN